jgi:UDP-glucose 4-epimerase
MHNTILVVGGAGYIGSHTAFLLAQHGYKVIVLDNLLQGQTFSHPWATFVKGDFGNQDLLTELLSKNNIAAVMHFAAFIEVGESIKNPLKFYNNNVTKTLQLFETMLAHGVNKFIFSSSCAVYGKPQFLPLTENHPTAPISPYGSSKLIVETVLQDLNRAHGLEYVALRYFNAAGALPEYGLGERHLPESHIIPLLLRAAQTQKPFSIFGTDYPTRDGSCVRDYLHVLDIGYAHLLALNHLLEGKPSDAFNLGTGNGFSVRQIIEMVEKVTETKIRTVFAEKRAGDPAELVADPTRAKNILQWQPRYSDLEFIIRSAHVFEQQAGHAHVAQELRN